MAAAVSCGSSTPGNRKTTTWEKDLLAGSAYRNDVDVGDDAGSVCTGHPVGMMPKAGVDMLGVCLQKPGEDRALCLINCGLQRCGVVFLFLFLLGLVGRGAAGS